MMLCKGFNSLGWVMAEWLNRKLPLCMIGGYLLKRFCDSTQVIIQRQVVRSTAHIRSSVMSCVLHTAAVRDAEVDLYLIKQRKVPHRIDSSETTRRYKYVRKQQIWGPSQRYDMY